MHTDLVLGSLKRRNHVWVVISGAVVCYDSFSLAVFLRVVEWLNEWWWGHHTMKVWRVVDACSRLRWLVTFTLHPLYLLRMSLWCPFHSSKLGRLRNQSGHYYKLEGRGFETLWSEFFFFLHPLPPVYLILPATLGPMVRSASNRNEYQWVPVSRLSRQCGILNIS
jgi:hypothetical protein